MTRGILSFLFLLVVKVMTGQSLPPIPERHVNVDCTNKRTDEVLFDIGAQAHFEFAWNPSQVDATKPVTLHVKDVTVRKVIFLLFGNSVTYKVKGNHLLLYPAPPPITVASPPQKIEYAINGYTVDAESGTALPFVSVYDSTTLTSALSDEYGYYLLTISGTTAPVKLKVRRENYIDTFIVVTPTSNVNQDVYLYPVPPPEEIPSIIADSLPKKDSVTIHPAPQPYTLLDSLLSRDARLQLRNIKESFSRSGQVALLPFVSTNGKMSGSVVNHYSLNVIGGFSGGTDGVEIGSAFNIDRGDVRWLQVAGGVNAVGGRVDGVQLAGALNLGIGSVHGVQASGGANILLDTLIGLQLAGGSNFIRGPVYGVQVAGANNIVTGDMDGVQLAGGTNFTWGSVNKMQLAGACNYAYSTNGIQFSGAGNISADTMRGLQVAGGFNYARHLEGTQFSVLNIAGDVHGRQFGVINVADTCGRGTIIGLVSIVPKGMHELEFSSTEKGFVSVAFRTGIPEFYNILAFGFDPRVPEQPTWTFGYGIGHRFGITKHFNISLDLVAHHVNSGGFSDYTSEWLQLSPMAEWRISKYFALAAGPVFHYYITGAANDELTMFHETPIFRGAPAGGYRDMGWVGGTIAVRIF